MDGGSLRAGIDLEEVRRLGAAVETSWFQSRVPGVDLVVKRNLPD
jgi:hypothetical protein